MVYTCILTYLFPCTSWGRGTPFLLFFSLVHLLHLLLFYFFPFPFPLHFQAGGRRRRPNLGLVCSVYHNLYCLVKVYSGVLLYLVYFSLAVLSSPIVGTSVIL